MGKSDRGRINYRRDTGGKENSFGFSIPRFFPLLSKIRKKRQLMPFHGEGRRGKKGEGPFKIPSTDPISQNEVRK